MKHLYRLSLILLIPFSSSAHIEDFFEDAFNDIRETLASLERSMYKTSKKMETRVKKIFNNDWTQMPDAPISVDVQDKHVIITMKAPNLNPETIKPHVENGLFIVRVKSQGYDGAISIEKNLVKVETKQEQHIEKALENDEEKKSTSSHAYLSSQSIAETIPATAIENVSVEYDNQILTITLPRLEAKKSKKEVPVILKK